MFAIQLTGRKTGHVFVLYARYATRAAAQRVVDRMQRLNPGSAVDREIISRVGCSCSLVAAKV